MSQVAIKVGPADNGRHMTLDDFEHAEVKEGHLYELERGVVVVSDVPNPPHFGIVDMLRQEFYIYKASHPRKIYRVGGGNDCKVLIPGAQSERHPDIAIYMTPAPKAENPWPSWIPELGVEVVSPGSEKRDYEKKADDYHAAGLQEYWIVDAEQQMITILRRTKNGWRKQILRSGDTYESKLLPGFRLDCSAVLAAAES